MKAAVWHARRDVRIQDWPEPEPAPGEVKIHVAWCGLSGTDVHEYESGPILIPTEPHPLTGRSAPLVMGHEFSGQIVAVGDGVTRLKVGDLVSSNSQMHCGNCEYCYQGLQNLCLQGGFIGLTTDGAFTDFVCVPESIVYALPEGVDLVSAALLEPVTTGVHALRRGELRPGERVVVIGGGPIGLGAVQAAIAFGAGEVTLVEPVIERRKAAERYGARTLDPNAKELRDASARNFDLSIDCVTVANTVQMGLDLLRPGGRQVVVGVATETKQIDTTGLMLKEKSLIGTAGRLHREDFPALAAMVRRGSVDLLSMVTSRIDVDDLIPRGFEAMRRDRENQIKILVRPEKGLE